MLNCSTRLTSYATDQLKLTYFHCQKKKVFRTNKYSIAAIVIEKNIKFMVLLEVCVSRLIKRIADTHRAYLYMLLQKNSL